MHVFLLFLNAFLMMLWPLLLAHIFGRIYRRRLDWGLLFVGAATFAMAQVGHIPFNWLMQERWELVPSLALPDAWLVTALFLGLSAGVFEELSRYLVLRFWARDLRDWGNGIMLGIGHGGFEAFVIGLLVVLNGYFLLASYQNRLEEVIPVDQALLVQQQLRALQQQPLYMVLLGALERLLAIILHIGLSLLVLQVFLRQNGWWLLAAIVWHALVDASVVIVATRVGAAAAEGALLVFVLISLIMIARLYDPIRGAYGDEVTSPEGNEEPAALGLPSLDEVDIGRLERTRFEN